MNNNIRHLTDIQHNAVSEVYRMVAADELDVATARAVLALIYDNKIEAVRTEYQPIASRLFDKPVFGY